MVPLPTPPSSGQHWPADRAGKSITGRVCLCPCVWPLGPVPGACQASLLSGTVCLWGDGCPGVPRLREAGWGGGRAWADSLDAKVLPSLAKAWRLGSLELSARAETPVQGEGWWCQLLDTTNKLTGMGPVRPQSNSWGTLPLAYQSTSSPSPTQRKIRRH